MDPDNLVAMIPVDQVWANSVEHWEHPALKLLGVLEQKTKNRLLRAESDRYYRRGSAKAGYPR